MNMRFLISDRNKKYSHYNCISFIWVPWSYKNINTSINTGHVAAGGVAHRELMGGQVVEDFKALLEKSQSFFNGLRQAPCDSPELTMLPGTCPSTRINNGKYSTRRRSKCTRRCSSVCPCTFTPYVQLWKYQQEHRSLLAAWRTNIFTARSSRTQSSTDSSVGKSARSLRRSDSFIIITSDML